MADFSSGFAGGFADSFTKMYTAQQALELKREQMQRDQQLEQQQQIQKNIDATLKLASDTVEAVKSRPDLGPDQVQAAINPLIESAAELGDHLRPGYGDLIRKQGAALVARPPKPTEGAYQAVTNPISGEVSSFNKDTGQFKPMVAPAVTPQPTTPQPVAPPGPGVDAAPTFNQRFAAANPNASVGDIIPGSRTVTDIPEGAPAVPSSAPVGPTTQVAQAPAPVAGVTSDAIELRAQQLAAGNENAVKNLPRSRAGMAVQSAIYNRAAEIAKEKYGDEGAAQLNATAQEYKAKSAGAQVLGKRQATLEGAIANVVATAPIVADLSSQIDRTEYPALNKIILAAKEGTGDPKVVRLAIAVNTAVNSYARAQGGGNNVLTDTARNEAHALLQLAYSDGQLKAGVDQLLVEMQREKHETGRALNDYLKIRDNAIRQSVPQAPPTNKFITPGGTGWTVEGQ